MATLITAILGWFLVSFLHLHYLGRDEVARKKDSVQDELQSLADWALDSNMILSNSAELNEEYLSSKIALLELKLKELYEHYFYFESPYELDDFHMNVESVDSSNVDALQVDMTGVIYNLKISIEADYDEYCKNKNFFKRQKFKVFNIIKHPLFLVFTSAVILSYIFFTFIY